LFLSVSYRRRRGSQNYQGKTRRGKRQVSCIYRKKRGQGKKERLIYEKGGGKGNAREGRGFMTGTGSSGDVPKQEKSRHGIEKKEERKNRAPMGEDAPTRVNGGEQKRKGWISNRKRRVPHPVERLEEERGTRNRFSTI